MLAAPHPDSAWASQMLEFKNARVYPPVKAELVQRAGVYTAEDKFVPQASMWRGVKQTLIPLSRRPETVTTLRGRWIWGGVFYPHFGHFLMESMSRLWAVHRAEGKIDGILWIPKGPYLPEDLKTFQKDLLRLFRVDLPIQIARAPTLVECLIVPGPGTGIGDISFGTDIFRHSIDEYFAHDIPADGHSKIYVSRSGLGIQGSGILGEEAIDRAMEADGYAIIRPESLSIEQQIAAYKAADLAVFADGSAAHLYAMVARNPQRSAIILRRKHWNSPIIKQVRGFTGSEAILIDAVHTVWEIRDDPTWLSLYWAALDLEQVGKQLRKAGFVSSAAAWKGLDRHVLQAVSELSRIGPISFVNSSDLKNY